ncbi:MAG: gfo/Idh/MocA family oxidoreductase [Bacteroidetes bacterium]|nr:MAG: gfo/Idh/MocA family oxidoreductase [Bacteroidota bacterium]
MSHYSRRKFVKTLTAGGAFAAGVGFTHAQAASDGPIVLEEEPQTPVSPNDRIRVAAVGMGIMGFNNVRDSLLVPGVELVAVADLYDGHLTRSQEVFGKQVVTTRDYRELIARSDVDAIIISTSDHWHDRISIEALNAGKHVYCEKPMVHKIEEGQAVIDAEKKSGKVFQVGSQYGSNMVFVKAKELIASGAIGELIMAEVYYDRQSANGAWQYSIPTDASPSTVDWDKFLGDAPKRGYDATRFFRWRNYQDYGTGVAGDLFVHLFTGLHVATGGIGPERVLATGGLHYWKDGRDVPDLIMGLYDYAATEHHPAFHVQMRCNFVDGSGGGSQVRLIGSEGVLYVEDDAIRIVNSRMASAPGYGGWDTYNTFSEAQQKEFAAWYKEKYPDEGLPMQGPAEVRYKTPEGYNAHVAHVRNFYRCIREGTKAFEDGTFGLRAAGPALATNMSYFEQRIIKWDPRTMRVVK